LYRVSVRGRYDSCQGCRRLAVTAPVRADGT